MPDMKFILEHWREPGVMATVVHVQGSAYRRPGARMLLLEDGRRFGSISGGCLEGDLSKKAWWWTSSGKPTVRVYDTSSDEDAVWEFGLGCNGVIDVLLERTSSESSERMRRFVERARMTPGGLVSATVIRRESDSPFEVGQRWFGGEHGCPAALRDRMEAALAARQSCLLHLGAADVFVEWIGPPLRLFVFGAGQDALPLVRIAAMQGWAVSVADGRPRNICPGRFPEAETILLPSSGDISGMAIDEESAVVMMTHNFPQDERLLSPILGRRPRYLGLLGPVRRTERLFRSLGLRHEDYDVHAPVGLDTGAETPEAIAVSIVAEIQSVLNGREGGRLRLRREKIHRAVPEHGAGVELPAMYAGLALCEVQNA